MAKNIRDAFSNGKAFIPFITAGDPTLEVTEELVLAMADAGASLIEIGIPFSDPTAEGPVIMAANERSLAQGTTTDKVFEMVANIRKHSDIPLVFMTYANVVYSYGSDRFATRAEELGVSGVILPDVPYEEREEFKEDLNAHNVALISMIAPTSDERIAMIAGEAEGFLYIVSSLGVTGTRDSITSDIASMVKRVREASDIPCAVGFGISSPEQAKAMADISDGAIVGSAIVRLCGQYGKDCVPYIKDFVKSFTDKLAE
ncbi:MAG: tryptophan synthase subunit alpha [Lachnospiraceae bacterium]|nr:tryptophan synthase subunit alpha [Lachnospiraceae bacterium]